MTSAGSITTAIKSSASLKMVLLVANCTSVISSQNDANGRVITNTIEVKSKLESYQLGFQRILSAAQSANTFDEFKGYLINTLAGI